MAEHIDFPLANIDPDDLSGYPYAVAHGNGCACDGCKLTAYYRRNPGILSPDAQQRLSQSFQQRVDQARLSPEVWDEIFDSIAASEHIDSAIRYGRI